MKINQADNARKKEDRESEREERKTKTTYARVSEKRAIHGQHDGTKSA